jgi:hypothetical protein
MFNNPTHPKAFPLFGQLGKSKLHTNEQDKTTWLKFGWGFIFCKLKQNSIIPITEIEPQN